MLVIILIFYLYTCHSNHSRVKFMRFHILFVTVVWNPWDKKAKAMSDFGDDEYKRMVCVEAATIEKPVTLKPGEEWTGKLELSAVPSSYYSGQLDPDRVIQDLSAPEDSIS